MSTQLKCIPSKNPLLDQWWLDGLKDKTVVVAMSGGVDSSAAALMLAEAGCNVVGISMQVWDYRNHNGNSKKATCCAPADFDDARLVSEHLGFPFYVFDFEESFEDAVISPFVNSYLNGLTPNPCLDCNRKVKFRELRKRARTLGTPIVATGHYAEIRKLPDGKLGLFTGADKSKDQSYFLYALTQEDLQETIFPVGHMQKSDVREYLDEHDLEVAQKAESQDICFVSGAVGDFIKKRNPKATTSGKIVSSDGTKLGEHEGVFNYTVGQRKGLGLSNPTPLYVLNIDSENQTVTVGDKSELEKDGLIVGDVNWISGEVPKEKIIANVKLRYRHAGVLCEIEALDEGRAKLKFVDEWTAVSPGQAAVFYSTELEADGACQVFGGGIIQK